MNKIDTTQIIDPTSQQPFTGRSLQFLQEGLQDALNAVARGIVGSNYSTSTVYVLNGLGMSGVGNDIADGYAFYNQEIWLVEGALSTASYSDAPVLIQVGVIDPAYDPVLFSDGIYKNVHNIRRLRIVDQVSGTGVADYSQVVFVNRKQQTRLTPAGISGITSIGIHDITGSNFTCPAFNCNVRIYLEADVSVAYVTNGRLGLQIRAFNITTSTATAYYAAVLDNTDSSAGKTRTQRVAATYEYTNLPANTQLKLQVYNTQSDNHSLGNIYIRYELF